MLNLAVCKKLKQAGFPQFYNTVGYRADENRDCYLINTEFQTKLKFARTLHYNGKDGYPQGCFINFQEDLFIIPSLSELIEACGDEFKNIERSTAGWHCNVITNCFDCTPEGWDEIKVTGTTPEEAVANLYLQIQLDSLRSV